MLPGVAEVLDALGGLGDAYAAWQWLTRPNAALDEQTPLQRLQGKDPERVVDVRAAASAELEGTYR